MSGKFKEGDTKMADPVQNIPTGTATGIPIAVNNNVIMKPPGTDNGHYKAQDLSFLGVNSDGNKEITTMKDLKEIVESLNKLLEVNKAEVRFSLFKDPDTIVVRLIEQASGKVIREIPSVKMLQIVQSFMQMMGILIDEKV